LQFLGRASDNSVVPRKICNIISRDAWGVEIFPFSGFAWGSTAFCRERSTR
jgi:hypothetical protein